MLHQTQTRLVLVLLVVIGALAGGLVLFQRAERARILRFLHEQEAETNITFDKLVDLKGASLAVFAYDYSYWDEMVRCIRVTDIAWADENIAEALHTYQAQAAWVYRPDRGLVYAAHDEDEESLAGFTLPDEALAQLNPVGRFWHFFVPSPSGLLEVRAATVHPSADDERKTKPQGYLVVGRLWNEPYIDELGRLTGATVALTPPAVGRPTGGPGGERTGVITVARELADWQGRPLATVVAKSVSYAVQEFRRSANQQFGMLILVAVLTIGLIWVALVFYVTRPLSLLSGSLSTERPEMLAGLRHDRSEFGLLGRLVTRFFEQKADLVKEVAERKRVEAELASYRDHLEELAHARTRELELANKELEAFSYSVSHDLRAPLRAINGFAQALEEDYAVQLDAVGRDYLGRVRAASCGMAGLIDDLLALARIARMSLNRVPVNLGELARTVAGELRKAEPKRQVELVIQNDMVATADPLLTTILLRKLLDNAWKFTSKHPTARIEVGETECEGERTWYVRDDGAGFDMTYIDNLSNPFQRLHGPADFPGAGVGLVTVQRILRRHGGRGWIEGAVEKGATFYFTFEEVTKEA